MSDEEHSDYPEEQQTAERKSSRRGRHFDKVEVSKDTGWIDFAIFWLFKAWFCCQCPLKSNVNLSI